MANRPQSNDPRVKRTKQLIYQAFMSLAQEKDFKDISVQDVTERATINRATFYAHFEDKHALIDSWIREEFQRVFQDKLPASSALSAGTLSQLILIVFHFLGKMHSNCKPGSRQFDPLLEAALQQEIAEILLTWLKQAALFQVQRPEALETTAHIISWAIFGPAVDWSHGARARSAEEMAQQVTQTVIGGLASIVSIPQQVVARHT